MFRFNNRINMNDGDRFVKALSQVGGKRLTWVELILPPENVSLSELL